MLVGKKGKEVSLFQSEKSEINLGNCPVCMPECPCVPKKVSPASSTNQMILLWLPDSCWSVSLVGGGIMTSPPGRWLCPGEKQVQVNHQKEDRGPLLPTPTSANLAHAFTYAVTAHLCSGPERQMLSNANT